MFLLVRLSIGSVTGSAVNSDVLLRRNVFSTWLKVNVWAVPMR